MMGVPFTTVMLPLNTPPTSYGWSGYRAAGSSSHSTRSELRAGRAAGRVLPARSLALRAPTHLATCAQVMWPHTLPWGLYCMNKWYRSLK